MKFDEFIFLMIMLERGRTVENQNGIFPRNIINDEGFPINYKRAWYLLEKWNKKGWYSYGVTLDLGWLTKEGINKAIELRIENEKNTDN